MGVQGATSGEPIRELQSRYPYGPAVLEKVCRISDFVAQVSGIPLIRDHLLLYSGAALNFRPSSCMRPRGTLMSIASIFGASCLVSF